MAGVRATSPEDAWPPHKKGAPLPGAGIFAMRLFLASLSVPFIVCLIGYAKMRSNVSWEPGSRELPALLWLSTLCLLFCSVAVQVAKACAKSDHYRGMRSACLSVLLIGGAFLVCQTQAWLELADQNRALLAEGVPELAPRVFIASFSLLTGLHAVHVIAGLVLQSIVTVKAFRRRYWSLHHPGITYTALYWHFLGCAWLLIFAALSLGT